MLAVPRDKLRRVHASSGTTGRATVVGYTEGDCALFADMVARSLRAAGVRPGDMVHNAYGYGLFTGGLGTHHGIERLGAAVVPMGGGQTERQVQLIRDLRPDAIMVTPSYMLAILDEFRRRGLDPRACSLGVGVFGAEPWTNVMREEVEGAFDMHAVDIYGLSEIVGPGVANECVETKDGLHVWEDHFLPEVIDPETGEVLPDGEKGELVFTTLSKEALPMIRYRTRDLTRLMPGTARSMRRMEKVTGRSDDMIILRGVNVFPTQIEEQVLAVRGLAPHFQIELTRSGRMDAMRLHVEIADRSAGQNARIEASDRLGRRVKDVGRGHGRGGGGQPRRRRALPGQGGAGGGQPRPRALSGAHHRQGPRGQAPPHPREGRRASSPRRGSTAPPSAGSPRRPGSRSPTSTTTTPARTTSCSTSSMATFRRCASGSAGWTSATSPPRRRCAPRCARCSWPTRARTTRTASSRAASRACRPSGKHPSSTTSARWRGI